jgi:uncharacterized protein YceK
MMPRVSLLVLLAVGVALSGCGSLKKFTGQRDDTVLPGEREDVLSPEQQRNKRPGADKGVPACDPAVDVDCNPPAADDSIAAEDVQ